MKNLHLIIFLFIGIAASAQVPEKMSYQAVLRDASGALLKDKAVSIQFTVNQTSASGMTVYQENHTPTTNSNGLVSVYMGTGTVSSGDFSKIDWSEGPYFLQSEIDPTGGTDYVISSTTELVSVPYALYANKAEFADSLTGGVNETDPVFDASIAKGITDADTAYWNGKLDGYTETDPVFDVSIAKGITASDTTYWNHKLDSSSIQNFVDLTTNQTVAGEKEFSSDLTVNGITVGKGGGAKSSNTAVGVQALYSNTTGDNNTANGLQALYDNTTGNSNTANGVYALKNNTIGKENTANGNEALRSNITGSSNTALGYYADVSLNNLNNAMAIGHRATASATNKVRIGNSSVTVIEGQVAFTNVSDGRIKENVQEAVPGLSFIAELRPVTYTLNTRKQDEITMQAMPDSIQEERMLSDDEYLESSSVVRTGFIAQEVEAAAQKVGFDFDGVSTPENETDLYGIRYAEFVVPLVKAMQEQQAMIEQLKERIEALEKE